MARDAPQLSVLMPVYNTAPYLKAAIESVLCQSFSDFELLLIEDGSSDDTLAICREYEARDERVRVLCDGENRGIVSRLNQGIGEARAEFIGRMDGDDISLPRRFEIQMARLAEDPALVLVGSRAEIIDPEGDPICVMGIALTHDEIVSGLLRRYGQLVYHPSVIMRKAAVERIGGYRAQYNHVEDLDLFLRLAETGKLENIEEPLIQYREHFAKVGASRLALQEERIDAILREAFARRGLAWEGAEFEESNRKPLSRSEVYRMWGWWALDAGNARTARKYAFKALQGAALEVENWRLAYCAVRGR